MAITVGFDVYGTLVDPLGMSDRLAALTGDARAAEAAQLWRAKQIEYAFRRAAMGAYADFSVCTRHALHFTFRRLNIPLSDADAARLLDAYVRLPAYPDVIEGLRTLRKEGRRLVAFSNGTSASVRAVLDNAGILPLLDDVMSVDEVGTFKPAPAVYHRLVHRGGAPPERTWLVSSNGWDVIGAKYAAIRALWLARDPNPVFDPWGIEPDAIARGFAEIDTLLTERAGA